MRAIKVDDRTAWRIIENWSQLMREWQKKHAVAEVAEVAAEVLVKYPLKFLSRYYKHLASSLDLK